VALHLTFERQRVPMLDASTLDDRTRPAPDRSTATFLRYLSCSRWRPDASGLSAHDPAPMSPRLRRRRRR
jgi:hypothetical protein